MFARFFDSLRRFMSGRYGMDNLTVGLFLVYLVCNIATGFSRLWYIRFAPLLILAFALFRVFSKNTERRRRENEWFARWWSPIVVKSRKRAEQRRDPYYRYYKCPKCKATLRVPKGRGKLEIRCTRCSHTMIKKT